MENRNSNIFEKLISLYDDDQAKIVFDKLKTLISEYKAVNDEKNSEFGQLFSHKDVIMITYGNSLLKKDENPLKTLFDFFNENISEFINIIHILPFFPYSSDDGFSVIDYLTVNPELGDWDDVLRFKSINVRLMFDAVINHISAKSYWFQQFLLDDPKYKDYFICVEPNIDVSQVVRPRTLPLITPFETRSGKKWVWTTFSADQIDLNYKNPDLLIDMIHILLEYIRNGANLIRLDAIAYLWKEPGTSCIHLPQTHKVIQLIRAIIEEVDPSILIITETNVPHQDNISYFGNGENEAHMVYQFSLPPLVAHAILAGTSEYLCKWAETLHLTSNKTTFFNFTASHDGIGVMPLKGILPDEEINLLYDATIKHGGKISSKTNSDGSSSPYELNITYYDLLNNSNEIEPEEVKNNRFIISQAIPLVLEGIPGIYIHNLLGTRNFYKGVEETGMARSINRQKLDANEVQSELSDSQSNRTKIFNLYKKLLLSRSTEKSFHPNAKQEIVCLSPAVFSVLRTSLDEEQKILAIHNLSNEKQSIMIDSKIFSDTLKNELVDVLSGKKYEIVDTLSIELSNYELIWLKYG